MSGGVTTYGDASVRAKGRDLTPNDRSTGRTPGSEGGGCGYSLRAMERGRGDSGDDGRSTGGATRAADGALLGKDDPPAFEVLNPEGAAPVVFLCDHASNRIPRALDGLGLAPADLERHIAWDIGAAAITRRLAAHFNAPAVLAGYSRLVIDCNRRLEDEQSILSLSDGTTIPGNRNLTGEDSAARVDACFEPYHRACTAVLDAVEARGGEVPAVVMMHSFTPVMNGALRPWHAGVLWDGEDGRMALPLLRALRARDGLHVGDNEPYSGTSRHGYTMPAHAARHGRANVQIEVRQDLIADEAGIERWSAVLIGALTDVFADPSLYARRTR